MSIVASFSLTDLSHALLEQLAKRSGLSRSEIVRRLIIAHSAGQESTTLLPKVTADDKAKAVWKEIVK